MKKGLTLLLALVICAITLSSCSLSSPDALSLAKTLDEADYYVEIYIADEDIKEIAKELIISRKDIYCYLYVESNDDYFVQGMFFFCNEAAAAEDLAEDLEDFYRDNTDFCTDGIIESKGKMVFLGSESIWDDAQ